MEKQKKRKVFTLISDSFTSYFKHLYVALPMLIWLLIVTLLGLITLITFVVVNKNDINEINLISQGKSLTGMPDISLFPFIIKLLIVTFIFIIVGGLIYSFFISSTLVFARDIVNKKMEKGFKNHLKNSFKYSKYWLKWIGVKVFQGILGIIYLAISIGLITLTKGILWLIILVIILLGIIGYLLYLFILPIPYVLVFYDKKILKSISLSIRQVYKNYWSFLALNLIVDVGWFVFGLLLSLIWLSPLVFLLNFLFLHPFKALLYMLFMKERFMI
ncbi:MAG: hypothetical protein QW244_00010 [Candidatus Pacearchaeota archaeon]